ncbi:MAG: DUF1294 domain-containing protein [Proteobacteria bacterium]|nr:DUF1294 domain-containing protein [Pseudomonadota bacterium]MBU1649135.1 DUF1294 domain-containing protein [Pseudomonadota bacterium]
MRHQGKITNWKDDRGFGFISPNNGDSHQVFVHIKSFANQQKRPIGNEIVTYTLKTDAKGRSQAVNVLFDGDHVLLPIVSWSSNVLPILTDTFSLLLSVAFLVFVAWTAFTGKLPAAIFGLYFIASAITFFIYALDKSAAKNDQWRTQESTLHFFALAGGWPGALAAQKLLRHKSKKRSFQIVFWTTMGLNCVTLECWILTSSSTGELRSLLGTTWWVIKGIVLNLHL